MKLVLILLLLFPSICFANLSISGANLTGTFKANVATPLVLCVGDSITYGTANGNFGYRARLQSLLGVSNYRFVGSYRNPASDQTYSVFHAGLKVNQPDTLFSTGYTASMNTRTQDELNERFKGSSSGSIILLHGGTNNVKQESGGFLDEATAVNDIADHPLTTASLVGYTVANYPNVSIYVALIIPSPDGANDAAFTSFNSALNTRLNIVRGTYPQVHIVDMNSKIKEASPSWSADYYQDTLHLNGTGYDLMADTWYSCIQSSSNTYCDGN